MRRYQRNTDHFQTREKFFALFESMKAAVYPKGATDEDFKKLLFAVQYAERYPSKNSKSGRRRKFDDTFLFNSSLKIKAVLQNETGGRISLLRFVSTYLPILNYPGDLQTALDKFKINLEEARILARINRRALGETVKRKPSEIRKELIDSHLKRQGTQAELRNRVLEKLNVTPKRQAQQIAANVTQIDYEIDKLLEFNEFDTEHLLWEEIKGLVFLMREIDPLQLNDQTTGEILNDLDNLKLKLLKFRRTEKSD
jgi:hypothetical protein